eukprot:COSAG02_NODE_140_length_34374_cov_913.416443_29_plen_68_part_00
MHALVQQQGRGARARAWATRARVARPPPAVRGARSRATLRCERACVLVAVIVGGACAAAAAAYASSR